MSHHRCTRCKQEADVRYKWHGGVYCESCIRWIRGGMGFTSSPGGSWFGSLWERVLAFVSRIFHPRTRRVALESEQKADVSRMRAAEIKAKSIPRNPLTLDPQKR